MRTLKFSLVLALSIAVFSTIGFAGCSSNNTSSGGTGGASAAGGSSGAAGSGAGGNTGSGGHADAGSDARGGAAGQDSGAGNPNCTALLACCNTAPAGPLKTACMSQYTTAMAQGDSACASTLEIIRGYGVCN
jgi:hypothetical protein